MPPICRAEDALGRCGRRRCFRALPAQGAAAQGRGRGRPEQFPRGRGGRRDAAAGRPSRGPARGLHPEPGRRPRRSLGLGGHRPGPGLSARPGGAPAPLARRPGWGGRPRRRALARARYSATCRASTCRRPSSTRSSAACGPGCGICTSPGPAIFGWLSAWPRPRSARPLPRQGHRRTRARPLLAWRAGPARRPPRPAGRSRGPWPAAHPKAQASRRGHGSSTICSRPGPIPASWSRLPRSGAATARPCSSSAAGSTTRRKSLLAALGYTARLFEPVARSLQASRPKGLELSPGEAAGFLRETAPLLEQSGFGVLVPPWWNQRGSRLGLRLKARPEGILRRPRGRAAEPRADRRVPMGARRRRHGAHPPGVRGAGGAQGPTRAAARPVGPARSRAGRGRAPLLAETAGGRAGIAARGPADGAGD